MKKSIELGDVVRRFAPAYLKTRGNRILPSQKKALCDIASCGTAALGGHQYRCRDCHATFWVYHSCRNRSCPACHGRETRRWLRERKVRLLGCDYYHIVVTVPRSIRAAFLSEQKIMYSLLMKTAADCVKDLAKDDRFLGATPAILSVLHTWTGDMQYHPHVHMLVSAGGISDDGQYWLSPRIGRFLIPVRALSQLIRGRFKHRLRKRSPQIYAAVSDKVWREGWNAFSKHYGKGLDTILNYLGRYVFRIAISNARINSMDEAHVTFRAKNGRIIRLKGEEFLRRYVMHILPKGFHKVRYCGLWHHSKINLQSRARFLLDTSAECGERREPGVNAPGDKHEEHDKFIPKCPVCGCCDVLLKSRVKRTRSPPVIIYRTD